MEGFVKNINSMDLLLFTMVWWKAREKEAISIHTIIPFFRGQKLLFYIIDLICIRVLYLLVLDKFTSQLKFIILSTFKFHCKRGWKPI